MFKVFDSNNYINLLSGFCRTKFGNLKIISFDGSVAFTFDIDSVTLDLLTQNELHQIYIETARSLLEYCSPVFVKLSHVQ